MKKAIIYLLLFSYSLMLMRPVAPFAADIIAHTFWYSQHIATVHFENGKYHVHYQYMSESQKNAPGKNAHATKTETFSNDYLVSQQEYNFSIRLVMNSYSTKPSSSIPEVYPSCNYPPPKI